MLNRTDIYVAAVSLAAILAGVGLSAMGTPPTDAEIAAALYMSAMGILGAVDGNALERYTRTWHQWRVAVQMLERTGPVLPVKDSEGKIKLRRSPYVDVVATTDQARVLSRATMFHAARTSRLSLTAVRESRVRCTSSAVVSPGECSRAS